MMVDQITSTLHIKGKYKLDPALCADAVPLRYRQFHVSQSFNFRLPGRFWQAIVHISHERCPQDRQVNEEKAV